MAGTLCSLCWDKIKGIPGEGHYRAAFSTDALRRGRRQEAHKCHILKHVSVLILSLRFEVSTEAAAAAFSRVASEFSIIVGKMRNRNGFGSTFEVDVVCKRCDQHGVTVKFTRKIEYGLVATYVILSN